MTIKHILVVDDSRSARMVLGKMLQSLDLTVDTAASGEEALNYLSTHHPDAIFMDHTMPGINGLQAAIKIKENPLTADIPIAMYTSKEENDYKEEVAAHKIIGVLPKPATPATLSAILKALNAALETTRGQAVNVTKPPAVTAIPAPAFTASVLENVAQTDARAVDEDALWQQILPLLEEKLAKLREDMLAENKVTAMELIVKAYNDRSNQLSSKLQQLDAQIVELKKNLQAPKEMEIKLFAALQSRLKSILTETVRGVAEQTVSAFTHKAANEIYDARSKEIFDKLEHRLSTQQAAMKADTDKIDPVFLKEINERIQPIITDQANKCAKAVVEEAFNDIMKEVKQEVEKATKFLMNRIYMFTILAVVLMVIIAGFTSYLVK